MGLGGGLAGSSVVDGFGPVCRKDATDLPGSGLPGTTACYVAWRLNY
jgi:hypothetical protein